MASKNLQGQLIDESFYVLSSLGEGGIGEVYLAEQMGLNRKVAIKFLHEHLISDALWQERFRREGKILGKLLHPNIVRCFACGVWQNKLPYLVFEYVEGKTLASMLSSSPPLAWRYVFKVALDVCSALAYAHGTGVIHRDLKPENIIIMNSESLAQVKLLDFGLACFSPNSELSGEALTGAGQLVGTPQYMSPEQCLGQKCTGRSDLYSLGCVMYEAICGKPPFAADTSIGLIQKKLQETPIHPSTIIKTLPGAVDSLLLKVLSINPEQRYESAEKLAEDIGRILAKGADNTELKISISPQTTEQKQSTQFLRRLQNKWLLAALSVVIVVFLSILLLSDPGPVGFVEAYACILPQKQQRSFLESAGDFLVNHKRFKAAEQLFDKAEQLIESTKDAAKARLQSKLATCSFGLDQKNAAIRRASQSLVTASFNGSGGLIDAPTIIRDTTVIEDMDTPYDPHLERALRSIMREWSFHDAYECRIHANRALQSLPLSCRADAEVRMCILMEGLLLAIENSDRQSIDRLIEHGQRRIRRLTDCREPFKYFLERVKYETDKNVSTGQKRHTLGRIFIETLTSAKAGSQLEKAVFASYVLKLLRNSNFFTGKYDELIAMVKSPATDPVLRAYSAAIASNFCFLNNDFEQCKNMIRDSYLSCRTFDTDHMQDKIRVFDADLFTDYLPGPSAARVELARLRYTEAMAQDVTLSPETLMHIAELLVEEQPEMPKTQDAIKNMLYEASRTGRLERLNAYYFTTLTECIYKFHLTRHSASEALALQIMDSDAKRAQQKELEPYYKFKAARLKDIRPAEARKNQELAARSRSLYIRSLIFSEAGSN